MFKGYTELLESPVSLCIYVLRYSIFRFLLFTYFRVDLTTREIERDGIFICAEISGLLKNSRII